MTGYTVPRAVALITLLFAAGCASARSRSRPDGFREWQAASRQVSAIATLQELHNEQAGSYVVSAPAAVAPALLATLREAVKSSSPQLDLRTHDVWGGPLWLASDGHHSVVWSRGADGRVDHSWSGADLPFNPADDIVLVDGHFIHFHAGLADVLDGCALEALVLIAEHLAGAAGPLGFRHPPSGACCLTPACSGLATLAADARR